MQTDLTYEKILLDLERQNFVEIPFPLSKEELDKAAQYFLEFLALPQDLKDKFTVMADPSDRGSDAGYVRRKKEKGYDHKEFFNYRKITEKLLGAVIKENADNPKVKKFLESSRKIYTEATKVLEEIIKVIDGRLPGLYKKVFLQNPDRWLCLRFVKYDPVKIGEPLAKTHYDAGSCTLAIAESAPGLRIGKDSETLQEAVRHGNTALFFPAYTFPSDTNSSKFFPGWHDVIQKSGAQFNKNVARWAIVFFANTQPTSAVPFIDTHTPRVYRRSESN